MEQRAPVLEVRRVTKRFPGVLALDDISFELRPGEVHALVGENGAGKSTMIKVVTGVYAPDEGQILFDGEEVSFSQPRESQEAGISTIYQEINLIPLLSVAQNVFLGREPRGRLGLIDRDRMKREAAEILKRYGIRADVTAPLRSLGLGVQQMVAIARAISVDARAVIMDEPTSSLEAREVETLFGVIRQLREEEVGVIYVSHRLDELYEICDRVTVLRDGRVAHTGELAELSRVQLIAHMLGRELSEVQEEGATGFGEEHKAAEEPVLQAQDLTQHPRLRNISFNVRPGEVVGLAGLLGAGRSETAKAIFGAEPVDSGVLKVGGEHVKMGSPAAAIKAGVAFLPEDRKLEGIIPDLSVRENIVAAALPRLARAGMVSEKAQDELVEGFMQSLGIKASSSAQPVRELSGGNQQKVLLARWLCMNPIVLMLDEPTRGIDVGAKAEIQKLVDDLAVKGLGVILISSELEEMTEGSDRVVVLRDGAVVGLLSEEEITEGNLMELLAHGEDSGDGPRRTERARMDREAAANKSLDTSTATSWLRGRGVYVSFIMLVTFNLIVTPNFASVATLSTLLITVSPIVLVSLGVALAIGTEGIDLSVGSVMALASAALPLYLGYGWPVAMSVTLLVGALAGLVNGSLVAFVGVQPIIATLAMLVGGRGLAQIFTGGQSLLITDPTVLWLGQGRPFGIPAPIIVAVVAVIVVGFLVKRTTFGRYVVAIGGNRSASYLSGHPVGRTLLAVYVISGLLAALAGIVATARLGASDPSNIGLLIELSAITAVVVGGTPLSGGKVKVMGTVMGALLIQLISNTFIANDLPFTWAQVLTAAIILVAVYVQKGRGAA